MTDRFLRTIKYNNRYTNKEANISIMPNEQIQLENYIINYKKYWIETPETNPKIRENHFAKIISLEIGFQLRIIFVA